MYNNTNKNSSVKTVAGENANERENEQQNAAIVSNSNKNKAMNTTNNQSSMAPQAGASDTTLGSNAKGTTTESVNELVNAAQVSTIACTEVEAESPRLTLKLPAPELTRPTYRYRELCKCGFKPAYLKINRVVDKTHARKLANDAASSTDKRFINSAKVVWAIEALEAGLELIDESGNELTLESKDIDRYFVIIDGQHRGYAMHLNEDIDLYVEFMDEKGEDILKSVEKMNTLSQNWTGDNYIDALRKKHGGKVPLLEEIDRLSKEFKVSRKYLQVLLCDDPNKIRLSRLKEALCKDELDFSDYDLDQDKVKFAEEVLTAIKERFGADCKATSTVMFITALLNIKECLSEFDKVSFEENLPAFIMSLTVEEEAKIVVLLSDKNNADLNNYMISRYSTFIQTVDIEEVRTKFSELFAATTAPKAREEAPIRKLKSGTVAQLIQNDEDLKKQKKRKEEERKKARKTANKKKEQDKED